MSMEYRERLARITYLLRELGEGELINQPEGIRDEVKLLCQRGLPDNSPIRPALYRHLLNLSTPTILVSQYTAFVEELGLRVSNLSPPTSITLEELPQDKLLKEIERDVVRTFGDLAWFGMPIQEGEGEEEDPFWSRINSLELVEEDRARRLSDTTPTPHSTATFPSIPNTPPPSLTLRTTTDSEDQDSNSTSASSPTTPTARKPSFPIQDQSNSNQIRPKNRREQLLRPLFIYASLNPGIGYVQGMNSIMGVLFWIFSSYTNSSLEAEASSFFAFGAILSQIRDLFVRSLDGSMLPSTSTLNPNLTPIGLSATFSRFTNLLTWLDPNIAASLESKQIDPSLYIFKWLTTIFANDFALPDLVLVWDRILSLYPAESESETQEALSPVLGHLLDISLGMVIMVRSIVISPFSSFSKVITTLQDPQIDGASVNQLLSIAWDIRERRLGKSVRPTSISGPSGIIGTDWRSRLGAAVTATATGPTANSFKQRFWSATSSNGISERRLSLHNEFDLDDSISQADSDTSTSTAPQPMLFASKGQTINNNSNRTSRTLTEGLEKVEGKFLPPSPENFEKREKFSEMNLPLPPSIDEESESGEEDSEDEDLGPSLRSRYNSWGGWKNSLSQITSSDTAAKLSKATTNLSIQATLLRERVTEETPERLARIKENVTAVSGRFMASTGSESSPLGSGPRRPGSPIAEPFTPPRWGDSPGMSRRPISPSPFGTAESFSGGPKPLLLSGSARRASVISDGSNSNGGGSETLSPPTSKRNSIIWRSPNSDLVSLPEQQQSNYGMNGGNSRVAASAFRSPSTAPTSLGLAGLAALDDHSNSIDGSGGGGVGGKGKVLSPRRQQEVEEEDGKSSNSSNAVPSANGRGWSLSDTPTRPTPLNINFSTPPSLAFDVPVPVSNSNKSSEFKPTIITTSSTAISEAIPLPFSPIESESTEQSPSTPYSANRIRTSSSTHNSQLSRRSIHLVDNDDIPLSESSPSATRQSSTTSISSDLQSNNLQRSKVVRKAPARKRTSKRTESISDSKDLVKEKEVEEIEEQDDSIREVVRGRESNVFENQSEVEDILNAYGE